ncbi:hypothetical protein [Streptomyces sp. NPDC094032]|uniref:hypothetical protein n=1 Tax=Streptomyces sp. NPDC094032 TaxID=3155308 RepID=UPI003328284B
MRGAVCLLLGGGGAALSAGVMVAVHADGRLPLALALWVDGAVALCWLWLTALLARRRPASAAGQVPDSTGGPRDRPAVRYRPDAGEPLARDRWGSRHRR